MISFGPIPSRRLGKSLGINNIISPKACSFECIYCQIGRTFKKTTIREQFYKPEVIYNNVRSHLLSISPSDKPDYLTFVSNGEPTIDKNLGESILLLKSIGIPVAVITNSSLLYDKSVRNDLALADWISLKVDAVKKSIWQRINRPADDLHFEKHIESILTFRDSFSGDLRTESMIVQDVNDDEDDISALADLIKKINPNTAYLSVPIRPPAEKWVKSPEVEKLNAIWQIFDAHNIKTELLTGFEGSETGFTGNIYEDILNITAVHPLREDTLFKLLKKDNAEYSVIESLISQKLICSAYYNGKKFFLREYHLTGKL